MYEMFEEEPLQPWFVEAEILGIRDTFLEFIGSLPDPSDFSQPAVSEYLHMTFTKSPLAGQYLEVIISPGAPARFCDRNSKAESDAEGSQKAIVTGFRPVNMTRESFEGTSEFTDLAIVFQSIESPMPGFSPIFTELVVPTESIDYIGFAERDHPFLPEEVAFDALQAALSDAIVEPAESLRVVLDANVSDKVRYAPHIGKVCNFLYQYDSECFPIATGDSSFDVYLRVYRLMQAIVHGFALVDDPEMPLGYGLGLEVEATTSDGVFVLPSRDIAIGFLDETEEDTPAVDLIEVETKNYIDALEQWLDSPDVFHHYTDEQRYTYANETVQSLNRSSALRGRQMTIRLFPDCPVKVTWAAKEDSQVLDEEKNSMRQFGQFFTFAGALSSFMLEISEDTDEGNTVSSTFELYAVLIPDESAYCGEVFSIEGINRVAIKVSDIYSSNYSLSFLN